MFQAQLEQWDWGSPGGSIRGWVRPTILDDGEVQLTLDAARESYFIDAMLDCSPSTLRSLFETLDGLGFELIDDEECEPVQLPSGLVRRYLTPTWGDD